MPAEAKAMSNPSVAESFVGRIALWNNDAYVIVNRYDKEINCYYVTALERPNQVGPMVVPDKVEKMSLEFFPAKPFFKRFPTARTVSINGAGISSGTIVDVSNGLPEDFLALNDGIFTISTSCIVRGAPRPFPEHGSTDPVTSIEHSVRVHLNHANDMVEFEDIYFKGSSTEMENSVVCMVGKSIVFRRCRFSSFKSNGVYVTSTGVSSKKANPINVIFEHCVFEHCFRRSFNVEQHGKVMFLNCSFHNNGIGGCAVYDGGSVIAKHCRFYDEKGGLMVWGKTASLDLQFCNLERIGNSIVEVELGGSITLKGCFLSKAGGMRIAGPKRSKLHMEECRAVDFSSGLMVTTGKTDIIIADCDIRCEKYGISIHYDVIGNVDIVNSTISCTSDPLKDKVINCGPKCLVTMDGTVLPSLPLKLLRAEVKRRGGDYLLSEMRCNKKAGVGDVRCFHCKKVEPKAVRFKKCGQCKSACYCSRECQVANWSKHSEWCEDEDAEPEESGGSEEDEGI